MGEVVDLGNLLLIDNMRSRVHKLQLLIDELERIETEMRFIRAMAQEAKEFQDGEEV